MFKSRFGISVVGILAAVGLVVGSSLTVAAQQPSTFVQGFERSGPPEYNADGVQVGGAFVNPCVQNELVEVLGSSTYSISDYLTNQGERRISVTVMTTGTGLGLTFGTNYSFSERQTFTTKVPLTNDGAGFESSFTDKFMMRGAKSVDNWMIRANFRIRIAEDGRVLVSMTSMTGDVCRG